MTCAGHKRGDHLERSGLSTSESHSTPEESQSGDEGQEEGSQTNSVSQEKMSDGGTNDFLGQKGSGNVSAGIGEH